MEKLDMILSQLEGIETRLTKLECETGNMQSRLSKVEGCEVKENNGKQPVIHKNTVAPEEMELGRMAYVGRYMSKDGSFGSTFGADSNRIDTFFEKSSFEMAKVIDAFASEERLDIIKKLMQERMSVKQLMESLQYPTTGKLYHHLSYLDKIGVITKENDQYFVTPKCISSVLLILNGAWKISRDSNE